MSVIDGSDIGGQLGEHCGWVKSRISDDSGSDAGGSNAGGWVSRWPVGGAPWVGGWSRTVGGGGGGAASKSLSNGWGFRPIGGFKN